jgi:hypothetical protein
MDGASLDEALKKFSDEFFIEELPQAEVATIIRSVINTDRRNHPEKYEPKPQETEKEKVKSVRLIVKSTREALRQVSHGHRMLIDPFIPKQSIIQVVGFNGHGKSKWLLEMLWAASLGKQFGSAHVESPVRSLYLDFELASSTLSMRVSECEAMLGSMGDDFAIWSAAASGMDMNLSTEDGIASLVQILSEVKPEVVVIDTVRSAWVGMEENSPHSWVKVNNLAVAIRNAGCAVIVVHHRNKPGQNGMGREAGSTAQLKDIDTQIIVTKIIEDDEQAGREAALPDKATAIIDSKGVTRTAFGYLRMMMPAGFALRIVMEIGFGKLRQATENHRSSFVGWAENISTGEWVVVSSKTPRQKAVLMAEKMSMLPADIAASLQVPVPTINRWLDASKGKQQ